MKWLNLESFGLVNQPVKQLYRFIAIALITVTVCTGIMMWYHLHKVRALHTQIDDINRQRKKAQQLLSRYNLVQQQKTKVNEVLTQDKSFKIKEYITNLIDEQQINKDNVKQIEVSKRRDIQGGYTEVTLDANFTGISMQQLVTFMHAIEKNNERVYIKEVHITKQKQARKIDATVTVATLHVKES